MRRWRWSVAHRLMRLGIWCPPEGWDGSMKTLAADLLGPVWVLVGIIAGCQVIRMLAVAVLSVN